MIFDKNNRAKIRLQKLLALLTLPETGNFLDVSCGDGNLLKKIQELKSNLKLYGIDVSKEVISVAQNKYPNISFEAANVTAIPYPNNNFDIIVCSMTLHHYPNPNQAIAEMGRVLKPNGTLYIMDVTPKNKLSQKNL